ncbi:MAG: 16S rRNA (cytidine(1402)-2'-O)-methyltransferase [Candidatus Margulisbacteria bacterium]|nr:16S rRNA (cytidine(1402)-2'-O)-methyltransferase [Candidatus Margulisiibacteriota bacterium]
MAGTLFVVATPIGNLEDMTFRAVRILAEADLIAAEDTRHSKILLAKYNINTPLTSYHKFNIKAKTAYLIDLLKQGKNLAVVSDSGMPGISDPGYQVIRESVAQGIKVEIIPGPSAVITALVGSGLPTDEFTFVGFLPKKPGKRRKKLASLMGEDRTIVIYESPFRIIKTLDEIIKIDNNRRVAVCRELTKKFEEIIRGKGGEVLDKLKGRTVRGEIVLVISGQDTQRERDS